ncbi:MAG: DUF1365 domain-containing protein [Burkholderiaceae bacterium]|nr:DUF1365 domain-containing protein [Burkholderiaceae bacterium]
MNVDAQLLVGQVMHRRLRPVVNRFVYPVFAIRVKLSALGRLNGTWFGVDCWRPLSLRTRDYGPRDGSDLLAWIRRTLHDAGVNADGEVWLQTFPRIAGWMFNPVSFWYCHDAAGALRAVLAEVNNTFGQHHRYLLCAADGGAIGPHTELTCRKVLHVSPFCQVEGGYRFRFANTGATALVRIDYHDRDGLLLQTSIGGRLQPFDAAHLRRALLRQPLLALQVVGGIHWQALRLWIKGVPFFGRRAHNPSSLENRP